MATYRRVRLSELIFQNAVPEKITDMRNERYITVSLYGKGVRERVIKDDKYPVPFVGYRVSEGQFIYSRIDARNGAYGIIGPELDGFVVSKDFPVYNIDTSRVLPKFLLRSVLGEGLLHQVKNSSFGATNRMRVKEEVLENYSIFLPPIEEQARIAKLIDAAQFILELRQRQLDALDTLIKARFVEMFGDLRTNPHGWPVHRFEEITEIITDGEHATPRRTDQGIYLLSARNVLDHAIQLEDVDYIDQDEYDRIAKRIVPKAGDVLISCSGSVGRCCTVPEGLQFQMVRSAALLRFRKSILPVYAEYMITSDDLQDQINSSKTASSQANLFQGKIAKLRGFVPPIELQKQFVSFVSQIDKSKVAVQAALEKAQLLFDSLMQQYFG